MGAKLTKENLKTLETCAEIERLERILEQQANPFRDSPLAKRWAYLDRLALQESPDAQI